MVRARTTRRPEELPEAITDAQSVDNHLPIFYQSFITDFRQGMPAIRVEPPSSSELGRLQAELGNRILEQKTEPDFGNEGAMRMAAVRQLLLWGEVHARSQWDTRALNGIGDTLTESIDVFGILKDAHSIGKWPPRYLIEFDTRHVDEIYDIYGERVEPNNSLVDVSHYYDSLALSVSRGLEHAVRPKMEGATILYRFSIPPNMFPAYPEGMCFHVASGKILRRHKWQLGIWPYSRVAWEESELSLYPVGLIERLLQDQVKRNILTSLGFETALIRARGDLWASGPDMGVPRSMEYNPRTHAVITMMPPNTTYTPRETGMDFSDAAQQLNIVADNMHAKAGRPRPSLGQELETERTLGAQLLAHQIAATDVNERVEVFGEDFLEPIGRRTLRLYQEFAVKSREISMGPGAGKFKWNRKHLKGLEGVKAEATPNMSPATRRSMTIAAKQQRLFPPYQTARDEASARQTLLALGLTNLERMIAEQSEPLERILELAREEGRLMYQAGLIQAATLVQRAEMMASQPPPPEGGPTVKQEGIQSPAGQVEEGRSALRQNAPQPNEVIQNA
jgi:hypothetical protein